MMSECKLARQLGELDDIFEFNFKFSSTPISNAAIPRLKMVAMCGLINERGDRLLSIKELHFRGTFYKSSHLLAP